MAIELGKIQEGEAGNSSYWLGDRSRKHSYSFSNTLIVILILSSSNRNSTNRATCRNDGQRRLVLDGFSRYTSTHCRCQLNHSTGWSSTSWWRTKTPRCQLATEDGIFGNRIGQSDWHTRRVRLSSPSFIDVPPLILVDAPAYPQHQKRLSSKRKNREQPLFQPHSTLWLCHSPIFRIH